MAHVSSRNFSTRGCLRTNSSVPRVHTKTDIGRSLDHARSLAKDALRDDANKIGLTIVCCDGDPRKQTLFEGPIEQYARLCGKTVEFTYYPHSDGHFEDVNILFTRTTH